MKIIWDTVIKATAANFSFHTKISENDLSELLNNIYLITPNSDEATFLFGDNAHDIDFLSTISEKYEVNILLKGGHKASENEIVADTLINKGKVTIFEGKKFYGFSKHGTGCVLSSAIAANLTNNKSLDEACSEAKKYVEQIITSNNTRLGYHYGN